MVRALLREAFAYDPMFGLYVRVAIASGARRAEICGLRWTDVDLDAGTMSLMRSHIAIPGARGDRPTKTRSTRTVSLDAGTVDALRDAWAEAMRIATMAGMNEHQRRVHYVFSFEPLGREAWRPDVPSKRWETVRARAHAACNSLCGSIPMITDMTPLPSTVDGTVMGTPG